VIDLRPYQERTVERILGYATERPRGRLLVVLPPRTGKTPTFCVAARLLLGATPPPGGARARGLCVVPRVEILDATLEHALDVGIPESDIGVVYQDRPLDLSRPFQIATEGTLDRRNKPEADFVVWDEGHHNACPRRRRIHGLYPNALHLGFTGTPERLTGAGLDEDYDDMIVPARSYELIHDGFLSVPTIFDPGEKVLPKTKGLRVRGGDFAVDQLEKLVGHGAFVDRLVDDWLRLAEGRRTVVFAVSVAHSKMIVERFRARGVPAHHLDGDTSKADVSRDPNVLTRRQILEQLRTGDLRVVSSVDVLGEGVNLPEVKCVVLGRPTLSLALHIQQSARCMTPFRGERPRILDMVGNTRWRHGLPWEDRPWSLARRRKSRGRAAGNGGAKVRGCECGALSPIGSLACAACGHVVPVADPPPVDAKPLVEVRFTPDELDARRENLRTFARSNDFGEAWVERVMAEIVGAEAA
jgi:superfamily II DNA or RNA helicase